LQKTKELLKKTKEVQVFYESVLNKKFSYVYKINKNDYKEIVIIFGKNNFKHLTGMEIFIRSGNKKMNGSDFYDYIKNFNDFDEKTYRLKAKGYTEQKIRAMKELANILDSQKNLVVNTQYNTSSKGIRSRKLIMYLGLAYLNSNIFVPQTMIDPKNTKSGQVPKGIQIHCIYQIIEDKKVIINCSDEFKKQIEK